MVPHRQILHNTMILATISFLWVLLVSCATGPIKLTGNPIVIDADTVILSGERIRFKGIDAPETTQQCQDAERHSYPCGQMATYALIDKIGISEITCIGDTRGKYTRLLATCYLDNLDLNSWLVQHGYALAYRRDRDTYIPQEEDAREMKRGIWSGTFIPPWEWRKQKH